MIYFMNLKSDQPVFSWKYSWLGHFVQGALLYFEPCTKRHPNRRLNCLDAAHGVDSDKTRWFRGD